MKKIAIIGASYLQRPLVQKASELGIETHVFAWKKGNVVQDVADHFYPISILEKEEILNVCGDIGIDGITSIASDIAMPTVNYIADKLSLTGNTPGVTKASTDKFEMRKVLSGKGIECPRFQLFTTTDFKSENEFTFPVIVKPTDRSGSRGVTKVESPEQVNEAIAKALSESIRGRVIVEEFIEGREFSVEMISYRGEHQFIAITDKETTGAPYFVEIAHHQPANISSEIKAKIIDTVKKAMDALGIENGASHSEVFLTKENEIRIVEIAGRMGGELIGSHMVPLSTGYDFLKAVIQVALGEKPDPVSPSKEAMFSGVYYVLPKAGKIKKVKNHSKLYSEVKEAISILNEGDEISPVIDGAGKRAGIVVYQNPTGRLQLNPDMVLEYRVT